MSLSEMQPGSVSSWSVGNASAYGMRTALWSSTTSQALSQLDTAEKLAVRHTTWLNSPPIATSTSDGQGQVDALQLLRWQGTNWICLTTTLKIIDNHWDASVVGPLALTRRFILNSVLRHPKLYMKFQASYVIELETVNQEEEKSRTCAKSGSSACGLSSAVNITMTSNIWRVEVKKLSCSSAASTA